MATILTKQIEKRKNPIAHFCVGSALLIAGAFLLSTFSVLAGVALVLAVPFVVKGFSLTKKPLDEAPISFALSKLPDNYFVIKDIHVNNMVISHVVICPKGIFTIEDLHLNNTDVNVSVPSAREKYLPLKKAIMNSKALNDFMQNNKIGNYFVNTLMVSNVWDEKMKTYFPDIPVLKPEDFYDYFLAQENKYTDDTCRRMAELLELNIRIQKTLIGLKNNNGSDSNKNKNDRKQSAS